MTRNKNISSLSALLVLVWLGLYSCSQGGIKLSSTARKMSGEKLRKWELAHAESLKRNRELDDYKFEIQYLPSSSDGVNNLSFTMRIVSKSGASVFNSARALYGTPDTKMMYWTSQVQNRIALLTDTDTVLSSIVLYENVGNIRNDLVLNFGFTGSFSKCKEYFVTYDDDYLGLGKITFNVTDLIKKSPQLKI